MLGRIIGGLLCVGIGFVIVWKTRKFIDAFGGIDWADRKFGGGGTALMYKMIGIIVILVGFLWLTNMWDAFLNATLGSLFGSRQPTTVIDAS